MMLAPFVVRAGRTRSCTQAAGRATKGATTRLRVHVSLRGDVGSESPYAALGFRAVVGTPAAFLWFWALAAGSDSRSRHERLWLQEAHDRCHCRCLGSP